MKQLKVFIYLGCTITRNVKNGIGVEKRSSMAKVTFGKMQAIVTTEKFIIDTKINAFKPYFKFLYTVVNVGN